MARSDADIRFEEFRRRFDTYETFDRDPCPYLTRFLEFMNTFGDGTNDIARENLFANAELPIIVKILLNRSYSRTDAEKHKEVNDFIKEVLLFSIKHLSNERNGILDILRRVFNDDKHYYIKWSSHYNSQLDHLVKEDYYAERHPEGLGEDEEIVQYATVSPFDQLNVFFTYNIHYFGINGGFDILTDYIKTSPPIKEVTVIIYNIASIRRYMNYSTWKSIANNIHTSLTIMVSDLTDEIIRDTSKHDIATLFMQLSNLLDKVNDYNDEERGKICESLELEIYYRFLCTPYLEKRINGLTFIIEKIAMAKEKDDEDRRLLRGGIRMPYRTDDVARWLTSNLLIDWMDSHNLIELIFGGHYHSELAKRSVDLLKFCYEKQRFGLTGMDKIWEAATREHEADREAIFSIFVELIDVMNQSDLQHLFTKIRILPYSEIDVQILTFVKTLASRVRHLPTHEVLVDNDRPTVDIQRQTSSDFQDVDIGMPNPWEANSPDLGREWHNATTGDSYPYEEESLRLIEDSTEPRREETNELVATEASSTTAEEDHSLEICHSLEFLWKLCQESSIANGLSRTVATQAIQFFQDTLIYKYPHERQKYLIQCVENIRNNTTVLVSAQLMQKVLNSYHQIINLTNVQTESKQNVIKWLDAEHGLINELFNNFILFKQSATVQIMEKNFEGDMGEEGNSTCSSNEEEDDETSAQPGYSEALEQVYVSKDKDIPYFTELRERLDFLRFLYQNSAETLQVRHLQILWECMVINAFSEKEQDAFFTWFSEILNSCMKEFYVCDDELVHLIFTDFLLKLDPRYISPTAMNCLKMYFCNVNRQHGLLTHTDVNYSDFSIKEIKCLGLEIFWNVILHSRNKEVSKSANDFLMKVYSSYQSTNVQEIYADFLCTCMKHLQDGESLLPEKEIEAMKRINRALSIINQFLEQFESAPGETNQLGDPMTLFIENNGLHTVHTQETIEVYTKMTLEQFITIVAEKQVPPALPAEIEVVKSGQRYTITWSQRDMTLASLNFRDKAHVYVDTQTVEFGSSNDHGMPPPAEFSEEDNAETIMQLQAIFPDYEEGVIKIALQRNGSSLEDAADLLSDETRMHYIVKEFEEDKEKQKKMQQPDAPVRLSHMLSNNSDYFELLFRLMEIGKTEISSKIWALLNRIPTNEGIHHSIKTLEVPETQFQINWDSLLDPNCMYKLLYSLQIIDSFISPPEQTQTREDIDERNMWRHKFLELGGFEHLYNILMTSELSKLLVGEQSHNNAKCMSFLINVIKIFMQAALLSEPCEKLKHMFTPENSPMKKLRRGSSGMVFSPGQPNEEDAIDYEPEDEFPQLIRQVSGGLAQHLLELVNFEEFVNKLLDIIFQTQKLGQYKEIIVNSLDLLIPLVIYRPTLISLLQNRENLEELIAETLIMSDDESIRLAFEATISNLCDNLDEQFNPREFFLNILLKYIPAKDQVMAQCDNYFNLLIHLVSLKETEQLHDSTIEFIKHRDILEDRVQENQDKTVAGMMRLATVLLQLEPAKKQDLDEFVHDLYKALFQIQGSLGEINQSAANLPKFKHKETRKHAFTLLSTLCIQSQTNSEILLDYLYKHHSEDKLNYSFSDVGVKKDFVGLRNFGATCYMNSLMQQIFMMPDLRAGLLDAYVKLESNETLKDNLLYQMQCIMSNLQDSDKQYYEPLEFCNAFRDWEGQPMNVRQQQDVDEFYNLFCDKIETLLKDTPHQKLLRNHMGGTLSHDIISTEADYPYQSEREEHFMRISLDIKNKKTLGEALDLFIGENKLEGNNQYMCEKYDRKINAYMRCCIKSLPNTVVIHLKRFEFDYNTMLRNKMNDYFEFPHSLNLKPWSKQYLDEAQGLETASHENSYYEYKLVGVLVHSGIADAGHYYSYINQRDTSDWYEFNDTRVTKFNQANLKDECFGGTTMYGDYSNWTGKAYEKTRNAYLLIYERIEPIDIEDDTPQETPESSEEVTFKQNKEELIENIHGENTSFHRDRLFYDTDYFSLIKSLVMHIDFQDVLEVDEEMSTTEWIDKQAEYIRLLREGVRPEEKSDWDQRALMREVKRLALEDEDLGFRVIKLSTLFAYEMLIRAQNVDTFQEWIEILIKLYHRHLPACVWFVKYLKERRMIVKEIILECKQESVRISFSNLLSVVVEKCCEAEQEIFNELSQTAELVPSANRMSHAQRIIYIPLAAVARFMQTFCVEMLLDAKRNWRRFEQYFTIYKKFAMVGPDQRHFLIQNGCLKKLLKFFINGGMPFVQDSYDKMGDQFNDPNLSYCLDVMWYLACNMVTTNMELKQEFPDTLLCIPEDAIQAKIDEVHYFTNEQSVFRAFINNHQHRNKLSQILLHFAFSDRQTSEFYIKSAIRMIDNARPQWVNLTNPLFFLSQILAIDDTVKLRRLEAVLNAEIMANHPAYRPMKFFEMVQRFKDNYSNYTILIVAWWADQMEIEHICEYVRENAEEFTWMVAFLKSVSLRHISINLIRDHKGKQANLGQVVRDALCILEEYIPYEEPPSSDEAEEEAALHDQNTDSDTDSNPHNDFDNDQEIFLTETGPESRHVQVQEEEAIVRDFEDESNEN